MIIFVNCFILFSVIYRLYRCKLFHDLSTDKLVKQRFAIEKELWNLMFVNSDRCIRVLNECADAENTKACFLSAIVS